MNRALAAFSFVTLMGEACAAKETKAEENQSRAAADESPQALSAPRRPTLFGRPINREGFHFHASLGTGGGPDTLGLYHAMEIGWSYGGYTWSFLHTFLQNRGVYQAVQEGPDEIGGFMLQMQGPIVYDDLVWKFATGVGGEVDQTDGAFDAITGFGLHYGVDLHFPVWPDFGPTLSVAAMNVFPKRTGANNAARTSPHSFAASMALGFTFF